ncbi:MAG: PrsW family glutamic-type intramembrane protease [Candidatus Bipolaricaulaceae bacterium]
MEVYVRAAYVALGLVVPLLAFLRWLHPAPSTTDLSLAFLLGMMGTALVALVRAAFGWPEAGWGRAFVTAGGLEEGAKLALGWALVGRLRREGGFGPAEAALSLAFLGGGFAAVEDFHYLVAGLERGLGWGAVVAARALPMHVALGMVVGVVVGRAGAVPLPWVGAAWALGAGLHGGFNLVAQAADLSWAALYAAGVTGWGLALMWRWARWSPWALHRWLGVGGMWEANRAVRWLGWTGLELVLGQRSAPSLAWLPLALSLVVLYPLLILALGLLTQLVL